MRNISLYIVALVLSLFATAASAQYVNIYSGNEVFSFQLTDVDSLKVEETRPDFKALPDLAFTDMVYVEGGTFLMGATASDPSSSNYDPDAVAHESPVHSVTLSSYYIGKYEVTQALWEYVMDYDGVAADGSPMTGVLGGPWLNDSPYSTGGLGEDYPAYRVSHDDIVNYFLPRLNAITGKNYRLPTEAEWEYAARGGNKSQGYKYSGSNTIDDVAWHGGNSSSTTHVVGTKQANELGIYDMSGNVWEWCSDWYGDYSSSAQTDPTGPSTGTKRVFRGGGKDYIGNTCRVTHRANYCSPNQCTSDIGFRLVCEP